MGRRAGELGRPRGEAGEEVGLGRSATLGLPGLALGTPRGMPGEAEGHPGVASPPQVLVGPSRTRASLGTG